MHRYTHKHMHVMYVKVGNPYASQHILSALLATTTEIVSTETHPYVHTYTHKHMHVMY